MLPQSTDDIKKNVDLPKFKGVISIVERAVAIWGRLFLTSLDLIFADKCTQSGPTKSPIVKQLRMLNLTVSVAKCMGPDGVSQRGSGSCCATGECNTRF